MKINQLSLPVTLCLVLCALTIGCNSPATDNAANAANPTEQVAAKPDMAVLKAAIQALETQWATADNARDANAIAAFYADDAVSMANNAPMLVGKAAILKDVQASLAKRLKGANTAYTVMDVFGDENTVTEVGKTTRNDASGKVISTGKYMAIWEKRGGKLLCIRDISNDDVKAK